MRPGPRPHLLLLQLQLLHLLEQRLSLEFALQLPPFLFCFHPLQRFPLGLFILIFIPFVLFLFGGFLLHGPKGTQEVSICNTASKYPVPHRCSSFGRVYARVGHATYQPCDPGRGCVLLDSILMVGTMGVMLPSETTLGKYSTQGLAQRRGSRMPGFLPLPKVSKILSKINPEAQLWVHRGVDFCPQRCCCKPRLRVCNANYIKRDG